MITCPNKNLQEWKDLVSQVGEARASLLWVMVDGDTSKLDEVNYDLKSVNILSTDKAKQVFEKGKKNNWDLNKILTELAVPKEQKELILGLDKTNREDIITDLLANYSYTIEINTAKEKLKPITKQENITKEIFDSIEVEPEFDGDPESYSYIKETPEAIYYATFNSEGEEYYTKSIKGEQNKNSSYYSNLTVPGGTNYTENAHIIPALKGKVLPDIYPHHDQEFAKGNLDMYGWDRSDEQTTAPTYKFGSFEIEETKEGKYLLRDKDKNIIINTYDTADEAQDYIINYRQNFVSGEATKTRRILEVQSKFQKWRLNFEHKGNKYQILENQPTDKPNVFENYYLQNGKRITSKEYNKIFEEFLDTPTSKEDAFIKFIAKQWETVMIKSIIQDSAKKGYEKVLFPTGNTAAKIEGHSTLEEFKKQKEDRIKELERRRDNKNYELETAKLLDSDRRILEREVTNLDSEIITLNKELERVEKEGFGALRPIYNFYENTVANILKKQGYNPTTITDEYGNTWNEVVLDDKSSERILFSKKPQPRKEPNDLHSKLTAKDIYGKRYIQPIGNTGQYRILKDWKSKGLEIVKKLENEYPGVLSWKTVNNEVIISVNPQMGLKFSKESSTEKVSEDVLIPILDKLKSRFNLDYKIINDPSLDWAGSYDGDVVVINSAKAGLDTPFHEFAHPFIRIIRNTNRPLYNRLVKEINDTREGKVALEGVKQDYPELKDTDQVEEAIVTLIGAYAEDNLKSKSLIKRIQEFIQEILNSLGLSKLNPKDLPNLTLRELGAIMASDLDVDISQAKQFIGEGAIFKSKKEDKEVKKEQKESAFEKEFVFFTRRVNRLERELNKYEEGTPQYNQRKTELDSIKDKLAKANEEQSEKGFLELGSHMLSRAAAFIGMLETDKASVSKENLLFTINTLGTFKDFPGLETEANALFRRIYPFLSQHTLDLINDYRTEGEPITQAMVDKQDKDISPFTKGVGALSDLANYIGRTIGSLIKSAQNKASSKNKQLVKVVQENVDKLEKFAKSNGMKLEEVYEMLIDETDDDIQLVSPYINGKENPKWEVLNRPENKEVKDFYDFYKRVLEVSESNLPYKVPKNHIPNIAKTDIKYRLQNLLKVEDVLIDAFRTTEDLHADMVPDMFRAKLDKSKKSRDLGASILEFAAYSNMHNELSKALPEVRLLQEQILYKQMDNGVVVERKYVKSTDPKTKINAKESNLYKMVDTVIDMQLKGKMSKDTFTPIKTKEIKNADGEVIGYKQVKIDNVLDLGLKYNSLLRIGLSPITAVANVSFGDVANIIEAVGGRFFGVKDLANATNIFFNQIDYTSDKKSSELYKWLDSLNPLQELDDYNLSDTVRLNKMTPEKAQEMMYSLQKKGELFLQSRTMLAVLIKEGYMTKNGKTTSKGEELLKNEKELAKLSDKIQRLNQMIHGRYSRREAATLQQNVLYRMMIQFRKWIPSAIEARFGERQYDNRLGVEIEGRYKTFFNLVSNLNDTIERLKSGNLSEMEIYNMKKNLIELTVLVATMLGYAWLHGGDDDEDKERRKNPYVKTLLTLTDRVAGDLGFFYNPANYTNLAKNAMPIAKTADDLRKVVMNLPYAFYVGEWEIKKGNLKGSNKFYESGKKVLIGLKPLQDIQKLFNENPLDEY